MKRAVYFILLFIIPALAHSQVVLTPDNTDDNHIYTLGDFAYYIDSTNAMTFSKIATSSLCRVHPSYHNQDFRPGMSYWVKISIHHKPSPKAWMLEFYDQTIDYLEAYIPSEKGGYEQVQLGDKQHFRNRLLRHKNFLLQLQMEQDTLMHYYFKVKSHEFADIRINFRSVNRFIYHATTEYLLFGSLYGMILIISLYNLLVYIAIREVKNLIYVCYILSVGFYVMSLDGIGFQYLWPGQPWLNDYATGIALYLVVLWALIFTRKFLSTKANAPTLDKALKWTIALRSALFIGALFFYPRLFAHRIIEVVPLSLIFYTGIRVWYKGYRPARFFVIAYGILFSGFLTRILVYLNFLPFSIVSHYSLHISFILEMLFLTFALGDRIRILKDNRDRALRRIIGQHEVNMKLKDKVNRELEQKVSERTRELEESNQKLKRQSEEISLINSMLDLENWKLKNNIKEILKDRLLHDELSYGEFRKIFPSKDSCLLHIQKLKWEKGYSCKKCNHEKYHNETGFSRRCSRCGYLESVTSNTIFHGIRFPIEKAFFILYVTRRQEDKYTLQELSDLLNIRLNTVWNFRKKIQATIARSGKVPRKELEADIFMH